MSLVSKLFGAKYNDGAIVSRVQGAIEEDPMIANSSAVSVSSVKGVVTLSGTLRKQQEKDRIEGVVRSVLRDSDLKHERIVNNVVVH